MERTLTVKTPRLIGQEIKVAGWVNTRRDHGGVIFVDLRDHTGLVQVVFNPDHDDIFHLAEGLRDEYCIAVTGTVRERGAGLENPHLATGQIELVASRLEILNRSDPIPVATRDEGQRSSEEMRLRYRYLDLRRPSMQRMITRRDQFYRIIRRYMAEHDFIEIATPALANSSPEGARDFLVPSRLHQGDYYALPQAPQQFKQLLMVGGVPRYYQIATCFRDEDPRADRLYGELYQLDCEMSFVDDGEVVRHTLEPLIIQLTKEFGHKKLVSTYTSGSDPIPRLTYHEAMERYGTDKPDLRYHLELVELTDALSETNFGVFKQAECIKAICVKNGASLSRKQIDQFTDIAKSEGAGGLAYITYPDGEAKSPIAKFLSETELTAIKQKTGAADGDAVFFGADTRSVVNTVLGRLRNEFATHFNLKDPSVVAFAWIIDFPFYEWDDHGKKLDFGHNPFGMPKGGIEALESATTDADKLAIVADQFDMVMNGYEICSGGVRNHNPAVLYKVFDLLGFSESYVEEKFGAMLNAFKYGAPPHAGCAFGVDRILMELIDETNVRETLAFPKNGSGVDVMMDSPSTVDPAQLKELGL